MVDQKKKILMLHGYVQSDRIFKAKTGGLRKALNRLGFELFYPCGPELVGKKELISNNSSEDLAKKYNTTNDGEDLFGWWKKNASATTISSDYEIDQSTFDYLRNYIIKNGPFEGIMGFSQGSGLAGYLLTDLNKILNLSENEQPKLNFFVSFSGFRLEPEKYQVSYNVNPISIPTLHVKGEIDTLVTEKRSSGLFNSCSEEIRTYLVHPGGHFVPNSKQFISQVCGWVQAHTSVNTTATVVNKPVEKAKTSRLEQPDIGHDLLDMIDSLGKL